MTRGSIQEKPIEQTFQYIGSSPGGRHAESVIMPDLDNRKFDILQDVEVVFARIHVVRISDDHSSSQEPPPRAGNKKRFEIFRDTASLNVQLGPPGWFRYQQQPGQVRLHADFVASYLVGAAARMVGLGRGEAVGSLGFSTLVAAATRAAGGQLVLVFFKIFVDPLQFTAKVILLPPVDAGKVVCQFGFKGGPQQGVPAGWLRSGPGRRRQTFRVGACKTDFMCERRVSLATWKRDGQPVKRPMLVNRLDLAARQGKE